MLWYKWVSVRWQKALSGQHSTVVAKSNLRWQQQSISTWFISLSSITVIDTPPSSSIPPEAGAESIKFAPLPLLNWNFSFDQNEKASAYLLDAESAILEGVCAVKTQSDEHKAWKVTLTGVMKAQQDEHGSVFALITCRRCHGEEKEEKG